MKDSVLRSVVGLLALIGIFIGGVALGNWFAKPTIDDLIKHNRALYEQDSLKAVQLADTTVAYNRLVFDVRDANEALEVLVVENEALASHVASQGLQITSLISVRSRLEYELEVALEDITITDTLIQASIESREVYDSGSIEARGEVSIDPRSKTGNARLEFTAEVNPIITFSRDEAGLGVCDMSFGDMPMTVDRLHCVDNVGYEPPTRGSLLGSIPNVLVVSGVAIVALLVGLALP